MQKNKHKLQFLMAYSYNSEKKKHEGGVNREKENVVNFPRGVSNCVAKFQRLWKGLKNIYASPETVTNETQKSRCKLYGKCLATLLQLWPKKDRSIIDQM